MFDFVNFLCYRNHILIERVSRSREVRYNHQNLEKEVGILDSNEIYATRREIQNRTRRELDSKYSKRMNDLYNPVVDIINLEVIPGLVHQIAQKPPQQYGQVVLYDGKTTKVCWELYNNKTWKNNPTFWMLFTSDGKFATSSAMNRDGMWVYEEAMWLTHKDDPYHHCIYGTVRMFDGLLAIGRECDLSEKTLSLWKEKFDLLYAEYCRASEARTSQIRDD